MEAILIINGQNSDVNAFIADIVKQTITAILPAITHPKDQHEFNIDPNRIYKLSDPELVRYLGYSKQVKPQIAIAREMRKFGISPMATVRRNGMSVMGADVITYLAQLRRNQQSFTSKK